MGDRTAAKVDLGAFVFSTHRVPDELLAPLRPSWDRLPVDPYLAEGYRRRRFSRFAVHADRLEALPVRPIYQTAEHNHLWGDVHRTFEPIEDEVLGHPAFGALCDHYLACLPCPRDGLFLRAHQIRIVHDHEFGLDGVPDPEGPHREGGRLIVGILPVTIVGLTPGTTRLIRTADQPPAFDRVLEPGELLLMNDDDVLHTTEPFASVDDRPAHRDIFLLTVTDDEAVGTVL
jgi:hypothetical protein